MSCRRRLFPSSEQVNLAVSVATQPNVAAADADVAGGALVILTDRAGLARAPLAPVAPTASSTTAAATIFHSGPRFISCPRCRSFLSCRRQVVRAGWTKTRRCEQLVPARETGAAAFANVLDQPRRTSGAPPPRRRVSDPNDERLHYPAST